MVVPREPISPSGRFPGCICTGSRNFEADNSEVFIHGIYIHKQPVNGGRHDWSCFCCVFLELECKCSIYVTERAKSWAKRRNLL